MTLSEVGRLATIAEKACASVIEDPTDEKARETLLEALKPLVNPTLITGIDHVPGHLRGLIRQVCTFSEIVESRILAGLNQARHQSISATSILGVVRDLNRVLDDLNQVLTGHRKG
jgi:hypothetical protein